MAQNERSARRADPSAPRLATMPKGTGSRHVYEIVRHRILTLEFPPGMDLDETMLVDMLGVSRTPVREALIRLGSEGLVLLLTNRSARVAPIELADLRAFFEALDLCLRATTRWAALRRSKADLTKMRKPALAFEKAVARRDSDAMIEANREFHAAIAVAGGNIHMANACLRLLTEGLRVSRIAVTYDFSSTRQLSDHLDQIVTEHRRLIDLIEAGDADAAEVLAGSHAELARNRVSENLTRVLSQEVSIQTYD